MSILSKICIVLLALLSVAMMIVIVSTATVIPNYKQAWEQEKDRVVLNQQTARQARIQLGNKEADYDQLLARSKAESDKFNELKTVLTRELAEKSEAMLVLQADVTAINASLATLDITVKHQNGRIADLTKELGTARKANSDLHAARSRLELELDSARAESERLQSISRNLQADVLDKSRQLEEKTQEVIALRRQLTDEPFDEAGPVAVGDEMEIVGTITAVSQDVASINIGSANGVKPGMKLLIGRDGDFIAYLRVEEVELDSAAGVIMDKEKDPKRGDKVLND